MAISGLSTRKPTGRVPWPCVLLEGEEKAGKSWALAQLSTSDKIGAGARWRKLQTELLTFPGIVVVTARGKEVTEVDANGRPIEGQKTWSVQTHREFPYAATVWVRLRRGRRPLIVGARSVHVGIKPNDDPAKEVADPKANGRLLEWLVFDALKCDPGTAHVRDLVPFHGGGLLEHEREDEGRTYGPDRPDVADLIARIEDAEDD